MDKIYLVVKSYDNGESYEEEFKYEDTIHAFPTRSDAEQYILDMPVPTDDDEFFGSYVEIADDYNDEFNRTFHRAVRSDVYETLAFTVREIPYC